MTTSSCPVKIPDSAREALLSARWDPIGELLEGKSTVARTAASLAYMGS